jgi:L-fuconolactonase
MRRRSFLTTAFAGALAARSSSGAPEHVPIIDSHIHLFDISRPQGVPWPAKNSLIYKSALPRRLREVAAEHGVVGAIEIECSPWQADNRWVLDVAAKDTMIVGTIGDLEPGTPRFGKEMERLHRNPLFRGIRYGNLWGRDLGQRLSNAAFVDDLSRLASAGLVLDTANPDAALIHAVVRLSDMVPNLTIVIDHLPELTPCKACDADLRTLAARPRIYAKVSGIVRNVNGRVPLNIDFYRDRLDRIRATFGADRLLYGSDWPNCELWAQYAAVFRLAQDFMAGQDHASIEKFFWRNSLKAYGWVRRDASQPPMPAV